MRVIRYCDLCDEQYDPSPDGTWGRECRRCGRLFGPCCALEETLCIECSVFVYPGTVSTITCSVCDGTGDIQCLPGYMGSPTGIVPCNYCDATGRLPATPLDALRDQPPRHFEPTGSLVQLHVPSDTLPAVGDVFCHKATWYRLTGKGWRSAGHLKGCAHSTQWSPPINERGDAIVWAEPQHEIQL